MLVKRNHSEYYPRYHNFLHHSHQNLTSGWGWRDVLPFFKKAERFAGANEDNVYGTDGHFSVMPIPHLYKVCKKGNITVCTCVLNPSDI